MLIWPLILPTIITLPNLQTGANKKFKSQNDLKNNLNKTRVARSVDLDYISGYNLGFSSDDTTRPYKLVSPRIVTEKSNKKFKIKNDEKFEKALQHFARIVAKGPIGLRKEIVRSKLLRTPYKKIEKLGRKIRDYSTEEDEDYDDSNEIFETTKRPKLLKGRTKRTRGTAETRSKKTRSRKKRTPKTTKISHNIRTTTPKDTYKPTTMHTREHKATHTYKHLSTKGHVKRTIKPTNIWTTEPTNDWTTEAHTLGTTIIDNRTTQEHTPWIIPDWAKKYFTPPRWNKNARLKQEYSDDISPMKYKYKIELESDISTDMKLKPTVNQLLKGVFVRLE